MTYTRLRPPSTHHPVSPGQQLLEVVKTCDTKAASAEVPPLCPPGSWLVSSGTRKSGTREKEGKKASLFRGGPEHTNPMVLSSSTKR